MGSLFSSSNGHRAEKKKAKTPSSSSSSSVGGRSTPRNDDITEKDRAVLDLKNARDKLKKYRKKVEGDAVKLTEQAKGLIRLQHRDRALLVLKLKRFKEDEVSKIDKELLSVMEMIDHVEWTAINVQAMQALRSGNEALNRMHKEMSPEDVEALLEETNEAIEVENQINAMLAGQSALYDSEELEAELEELMGTSSAVISPPPLPVDALPNSQIAQPESHLDLPDAPKHEVKSTPTETAEVEQEERRLAAAT